MLVAVVNHLRQQNVWGLQWGTGRRVAGGAFCSCWAGGMGARAVGMQHVRYAHLLALRPVECLSDMFGSLQSLWCCMC